MHKSALALALATSTALLVSAGSALAGELVIGGFAHDTRFGVSGTPHEDGTADIQLMYRTHQFQIPYLLNPMLYGKVQLNTDDRTNFYTIGVEWRKHLFHTRFYGDFGVGGAYVDGYNTYPDHFNPDSTPLPTTPAQNLLYQQDLHIYNERKAMGSDFVFNPNFAFGYTITRHFAVEAAWDHYSNAGLGGRNPGLDTFGGRLTYHFSDGF